jgi:hypothetical protein
MELRDAGETVLRWDNLPRSLLGVVLGTIAIAAIVLGRAQAGVAAACGSIPVGSVQESAKFTPYESRYGHAFERPITAVGTQLSAASTGFPSTLEALPRVWTSVSSDGSIASYFLGQPLGTSMTRPDFLAAQGILLVRAPLDPGAGELVAVLAGELGERATVVAIGPYQAILTYGDPEANGQRNHYLMWAEAGDTVTLVAERTPEQMVGMGRGLVCSSSA